MGTTSLPSIPLTADLQKAIISVNAALEELDFLLNGHIDSKNTREIGGWRVGLQSLESKDKDVGMSTADTEGDDIRFWAGDSITGAPPFSVTKSGKLYAANGEFVGNIEAKSGTIGGFTIDANKLYGEGLIEGGTLKGAEIEAGTITGGIITGARVEGAEIVGGTIDVETDVYVGQKIHLNGSSYTAGIVFMDGIEMFHDPASKAVFISTPGNVVLKGTDVVQEITDLKSRVSSLESRMSSAESALSSHDSRISALETAP